MAGNKKTREKPKTKKVADTEKKTTSDKVAYTKKKTNKPKKKKA